MKTPLPLTAALALGGLGSLTVGVTLPHAQAQSFAPPTSGADLAQRAEVLSLTQRVMSLENQVKLLEQQRLADKTIRFYSLPQPQPFGTGQVPNYSPNIPHVRPPAYIWPAVK